MIEKIMVQMFRSKMGIYMRYLSKGVYHDRERDH